MATVTNPTYKNNVLGFRELGALPLRADATSAARYIEENGLGTYGSFTSNDDNKFSNDGGNRYQYYVSGVTYVDYWLNSGYSYEWRTEYGYYPTIATIVYT